MKAGPIIVTMLVSAAIVGCASTPNGGFASRAPAHSTEAATPDARFARAEALLERGDTAGARREVVAVLAVRPADPGARELLDQIDMTPRALLGDRSFRHLAAPGETFDSL